MIELTGFTRRVYEMFRLFDSVNKTPSSRGVSGEKKEDFLTLDSNNNQPDQSAAFTRLNHTLATAGTVLESIDIDYISVDSISIISPNGDILIPSLSFKVDHSCFSFTIYSLLYLIEFLRSNVEWTHWSQVRTAVERARCFAYWAVYGLCIMVWLNDR